MTQRLLQLIDELEAEFAKEQAEPAYKRSNNEAKERLVLNCAVEVARTLANIAHSLERIAAKP